jgi:hypothetical protein
MERRGVKAMERGGGDKRRRGGGIIKLDLVEGSAPPLVEQVAGWLAGSLVVEDP